MSIEVAAARQLATLCAAPRRLWRCSSARRRLSDARLAARWRGRRIERHTHTVPSSLVSQTQFKTTQTNKCCFTSGKYTASKGKRKKQRDISFSLSKINKRKKKKKKQKRKRGRDTYIIIIIITRRSECTNKTPRTQPTAKSIRHGHTQAFPSCCCFYLCLWEAAIGEVVVKVTRASRKRREWEGRINEKKKKEVHGEKHTNVVRECILAS